MKFRAEYLDSPKEDELEISEIEFNKKYKHGVESDGNVITVDDGSVTLHPDDEDAEYFAGRIFRERSKAFDDLINNKTRKKKSSRERDTGLAF